MKRSVKSALQRIARLRLRRLESVEPVQRRLSDAASPISEAVTITLPDLGDAMFAERDGYRIVYAEGSDAIGRIKITAAPGVSGNLIVIGAHSLLPRSIAFQGSDNLCVIGADIAWPLDVDVRFSSDRGVLLIGRGTTSNGTSIILEGDRRRVLIGDDAMFAAGTAVRTSDLHGIADIASGQWLNPPADVCIGHHVWVGQDSLVAKGATIGSGTVIGAKALVTGTIPPDCVATGIPARVRREGVRWTRARQPEVINAMGAGGTFAT